MKLGLVFISVKEIAVNWLNCIHICLLMQYRFRKIYRKETERMERCLMRMDAGFTGVNKKPQRNVCTNESNYPKVILT